MFNKKAGFWGYYESGDTQKPKEVEVTPDLIKADGSLDENNAGKEISGSDPRPRYLDDGMPDYGTGKKADGEDSSDSVVIWHDKNNFTIKLHQAFQKYNAYAVDYNTKNPKAEKLPTIVCTDVLDDPKNTEAQKQQCKQFKNALKNSELSLSIDDSRSDNPDHVYLLGQTILLPIYYIDGNEGVTGLHFQGSIVNTDNKPVSLNNKELTNVNFPEIPFNNDLRNIELFKKVPLGTGLTQPDKLNDDGSEATYTVKIKGTYTISS